MSMHLSADLRNSLVVKMYRYIKYLDLYVLNYKLIKMVFYIKIVVI